MNSPIDLHESHKVATASSATAGTFLAKVSVVPEGVSGVDPAIFRTSPEATLERLDELGIEWYLTEQGVLLIKSWQVGEQNFVAPQQVSSLRQHSSKPPEADSLEWLSANLDSLIANYAGHWIAIKESEIVASSESLSGLLAVIHASEVDNPFITEIPSEPIVWDTAYVR